ncbi:2'-5' RNA ligase family protein [Curtobacterium sp. ISL-83]|uniref:2'-5' RNA ligase family protein n=1 Tax=Curtobacterium sp. ISL-83 TaxID=2819145 RepID=UPI0020363C2D|nr:2'-5' RNA ligase family protein [Curtobacterium sp. ISL-83]
MRSIELVLDPASDAAVRSAWSALVDADLPSLGRSGTNSPHVTLAAGPELPVPAATPVLLPSTIRLGGVLLFDAGAGRHVLVRAVVVDRALAAFHEAVHAVAPGGLETSLPGRWSPHVTLARRVRDEDLPRALAALAVAPLPELLAVGGVRHWDGETKTVTALA